MVNEALKMYLEGFTFEEIYDETGVDKTQYKALITEHVKTIHDNAYKVRSKWKDFAYRWDHARKLVRSSGRDLSQIPIVAKE